RIHAAGKYVIIHSHGKVRGFMDEFVKMGADGLDVLEPCTSVTGDVDLREVKQRYGKKLCLIGSIQYSDIAQGDTASIERMVANNMEAAKEGGGYIIEPTADPYGVSLDERTADNFITYFKMARKYGMY
ncbi:MAG: uroporphyrinogen decarboxylase family protein, partial [Bacillota bacterium]